MTDILTIEQIAEIEALLDVATLDLDTLSKIVSAAPALIAMAKRPKWVCFHCGFETSNEAEAEGHFGPGDGEPAMCLHWLELTEDERLKAYQETEIELNGAREAEHQANQRAEKAEAERDKFREIIKRGHWTATVTDNRPKKGLRGIRIKGEYPSKQAALHAAEAAIADGRPNIDTFIHGPTAKSFAHFNLPLCDIDALGDTAALLQEEGHHG